MNYLNIAKRTFDIEAQEILKMKDNLTEDFCRAIEAILSSDGKVILCGMGKSGIIAKKIAATLSSTGTSSFFLHPGEAYHGDLGMIEAKDVVVLISNSGKTEEVIKLIPSLKRQGNVTISITGNPQSELARFADHSLNAHIEDEGCPLQLAPMSSTTATLVMGDALAVALMKARNFEDKHFAQFHPGGALGKRLLSTVNDFMQTENIPTCDIDDSILAVIKKMNSGRMGLVVVFENDEPVGIITDGDLSRHLGKEEEECFDFVAKDIMSAPPKSLLPSDKLSDAEDMMNTEKVKAVLVIEDKQLLGVLEIYSF